MHRPNGPRRARRTKTAVPTNGHRQPERMIVALGTALVLSRNLLVSTILIRMHPRVLRNLPLFRHFGWLVAACAAGPASERRLQLPDRRVTRPADRIQRHARTCLAPAAFNFQPAVTPFRHWPIVGLGCAGPPYPSMRIDHASASARRRTGSLPNLLAGRLGAHIRAHGTSAPYDLACLGAHRWQLQLQRSPRAIYET